MPIDFEFATAGKILFGPGRIKSIVDCIKPLGARPLIVTGKTAGRAGQLVETLKSSGIQFILFSVENEPTVEIATAGAQFAKEEKCDVIIAFGGGSVIDAGKAIAALASNGGSTYDYLEIIGAGKPLTNPPLPCIAIPTTAGTGAEVTRNAVLSSKQHKVKVSLRSPLMLPRIAIVDPELTHGLPADLTASTGLDALTQLIEPYVSHRANPMTDALCAEGLSRAAKSLRCACEDGSHPAAREDMALASLFGGLALANAALGAAHGFASPIGGMFPAPHGAVCAALLPHVMRINIEALRRIPQTGLQLSRYEDIARILTGKNGATPEDGVAWVRDLCQALGIKPLRTYGIQSADFPELIDRASKASSMKGNPVPLNSNELNDILSGAW